MKLPIPEVISKKTYVVQWNVRNETVAVDTLEDMLHQGIESVSRKADFIYAPVAMTNSYEEAIAISKLLKSGKPPKSSYDKKNVTYLFEQPKPNSEN